VHVNFTGRAGIDRKPVEDKFKKFDSSPVSKVKANYEVSKRLQKGSNVRLSYQVSSTHKLLETEQSHGNILN